jgi:hypothetical protein
MTSFASKRRLAVLSLLVVAMAACGKPQAAESKGQLSAEENEASKAAATTNTESVQGSLATSDQTLPDGSYYDRYTINARSGERLTITLESGDFDAFLLLFKQGASAAEKLADDDDGAGGTNAQIAYDLTSDGTYIILANSYGAGATGNYTLRVSRGATASTQREPVNYAARYPGGGDPKGRYALLVGVDDYQGIGNSLRGPVADARLTGQILVERYGFDPANIVYLLDREASREHVIEAFQRHLGQAGPDGVAVFYYSGHGMQFNANVALTGAMDPEPSGVDQALYLWSDNGNGGMLLDDEMGYLASRLRTDRVLMISDACFSGSGTRGGEGGQTKEQKFDDVKGGLTIPSQYLIDNSRASSLSPRYPEPGELRGEPSRHIYLGGSTDEQVSWTATGWPKYGGTISVFTYYLAEAMEGSTPTATFADVMENVRGKTVTYTEATYNTRQSPQLQGRQSGTSIAAFLAQR